MDWRKVAEENEVLRIRCGSHLFGTNTPESDLDMAGVFMPNEHLVYGFGRCEVVEAHVHAKDESGRNTADAVDCTLYEFRKFVALAMQNNPNILHLLFANEPNVMRADPMGRALLDQAHLFPHRGAHHRFVSYAIAQRHKMRIKPENFEALNAALAFLEDKDDHAVLGEFRDCPAIKGDPEKGKHLRAGDLSFEPGIYVKKARRMIRERIGKATHRTTLYTKYGFDTKYASNLIHLLREGIDLLRDGRLTYPLPYAQEIVDIKQGRYELEQIQEWADRLEEEARRAYETTQLPVAPRFEEIEAFTMRQVRVWLEERT